MSPSAPGPPRGPRRAKRGRPCVAVALAVSVFGVSIVASTTHADTANKAPANQEAAAKDKKANRNEYLIKVMTNQGFSDAKAKRVIAAITRYETDFRKAHKDIASARALLRDDNTANDKPAQARIDTDKKKLESLKAGECARKASPPSGARCASALKSRRISRAATRYKAEISKILTAAEQNKLAQILAPPKLESRHEPVVIDDGSAERDPALAALATAAVTGLAPAGPERRERPAIALRDESVLRVACALSVAEAGFSLHAATTAPADDSRAREALCKYVLRPPIAQEHLRLLDDGLVRIALKRPFSDGTVAVDMDPLSLLCRLAASGPAPKFHVIRYAGMLASAHQLRSLVVPPLVDEDQTENAHGHACEDKRPPTHRSRYRPWAELMKRTFAIDVDKCEKCGARMRLRAIVIAAASIDRFLRRIGETTEPPPLSTARDPPYFKSVLRRKLGELDGTAVRQTRQRDECRVEPRVFVLRSRGARPAAGWMRRATHLLLGLQIRDVRFEDRGSCRRGDVGG